MNVLVTGGAGYIGSHIVAALVRREYRVTVIDDLSAGHRELVDPRAELVTGSILDTEMLSSVMRDREIASVIHMAARALVGEDREKPGAYYETNVVGTLSLLEAMARNSARRIVLSSTCAVYGNHEVSGGLDESLPRIPVSVYGETKLAMENATRAYADRHGLTWIALRYFNAAGADEGGSIGEWHEPETHLIPRAIRATPGLGGEALVVHGDDYPTPDGTCIRDYVHVNDLADAHIRALSSADQGGINLGSGDGHSVRDVIDAIAAESGSAPRVRFGARREGDAARLVASISRAKEVLGWTPRRTLRDIVRTAIAWERKLGARR